MPLVFGTGMSKLNDTGVFLATRRGGPLVRTPLVLDKSSIVSKLVIFSFLSKSAHDLLVRISVRAELLNSSSSSTIEGSISVLGEPTSPKMLFFGRINGDLFFIIGVVASFADGEKATALDDFNVLMQDLRPAFGYYKTNIITSSFLGVFLRSANGFAANSTTASEEDKDNTPD